MKSPSVGNFTPGKLIPRTTTSRTTNPQTRTNPLPYIAYIHTGRISGGINPTLNRREKCPGVAVRRVSCLGVKCPFPEISTCEASRPDALSHSLPDYRHKRCIHSLIGRFYTNEYSCTMTSLLFLLVAGYKLLRLANCSH